MALLRPLVDAGAGPQAEEYSDWQNKAVPDTLLPFKTTQNKLRHIDLSQKILGRRIALSS